MKYEKHGQASQSWDELQNVIGKRNVHGVGSKMSMGGRGERIRGREVGRGPISSQKSLKPGRNLSCIIKAMGSQSLRSF